MSGDAQESFSNEKTTKEFSGSKKRLRGFLESVRKIESHDNIKPLVQSLSNQDIRVIYFELYSEDIILLPKLQVSVLYRCTKALLRKWKGYYNENFSETYDELIEYLKTNLAFVNLVYKKNEAKCLKNKSNNVKTKSVVEIVCPYKHLKSIVYFNVHPKTQSVMNTKLPSTVSMPSSSHSVDLSRDIFNNPFIKVRIACPTFVMYKQNIHPSNYKVIRLEPGYKPNLEPLDTSLKYSKSSRKPTDGFPSSFIVDYLDQFVTAVQVENSNNTVKKTDLFDVLSDFKHEFEKCTHSIELNTEYYSYLHDLPYVRYLGQKVEDPVYEPVIEFSHQIDITENSLNLRLQETIAPCVKFSLTKFNATYYIDKLGKNKFEFTPEFISSIASKCISFKCTLCHFEKMGQMAKYEMETHIHSEHGNEPNWYCVRCNKEFPMKDLCSQRWTHNCISVQTNEITSGKEKKKKKQKHKSVE